MKRKMFVLAMIAVLLSLGLVLASCKDAPCLSNGNCVFDRSMHLDCHEPRCNVYKANNSYDDVQSASCNCP